MSRKKKSSRQQVFSVFFAVCGLLTPFVAFASVRITEVMYDAPGSDAGGEWIEVTNTGSSAVDIRKWKLAEGGTNHSLTIARGNGFVQPGESIIISNNPSTFMGEWGSFAGTIFKSALSLSNIGETIEIKNASSSVEDAVTYSSGEGGAGSGESLQLHEGAFMPALPTPGVYPGEIVRKSAPASAAPVAPKTKSKASATNTKSAPAAKTSTYTKYDYASSTSAPVAEVSVPTSSPLPLWLLGLGGVMVLGVAGALFARFESVSSNKNTETNTLAEEFDIQ